jgi:hypothetical protein
MDQPEKRLRGIQLSSVNIWNVRYRGAITISTYLCGTMEVHKQGTPEVLFTPRGALHMYMALRPFNLHLWSALLQFSFHSVFTSCEQTLKIHIVPTKAQKNLKPPCVY